MHGLRFDVDVWLRMTYVIACLPACTGGGVKIWLRLTCVTTSTCLLRCGLRLEGLRGCDMVMGEYCDQSMIHLAACIMGWRGGGGGG